MLQLTNKIFWFLSSFMRQHSDSKTSTAKKDGPPPVLHSRVASHRRLGAVAEPRPWQPIVEGQSMVWTHSRTVDTLHQDKTSKKTQLAPNNWHMQWSQHFYLSFVFIQGYPDWKKPSARHIARLEAETGEDHQPLLPPCTLKHELLDFF